MVKRQSLVELDMKTDTTQEIYEWLLKEKIETDERLMEMHVRAAGYEAIISSVHAVLEFTTHQQLNMLMAPEDAWKDDGTYE